MPAAEFFLRLLPRPLPDALLDPFGGLGVVFHELAKPLTLPVDRAFLGGGGLIALDRTVRILALALCNQASGEQTGRNQQGQGDDLEFSHGSTP